METNDRRDDLEARVAQLEMMQDLLIHYPTCSNSSARPERRNRRS